jgi:hypothetical protein
MGRSKCVGKRPRHMLVVRVETMMRWRVPPVVGLVVLLALLAGCGGDREASPGRTSGQDGASGGRSTTVPASEPTASDNRLPEGRSPGRTVTTASGAVVLLPPSPTETSTTGSAGCRDDREVDDRNVLTASFPPSPTISAMRTASNEVLLTYRFSARPRCRPTRLGVSLDVCSDPLPARTQRIGISRLRGRVRISIPSDMRDADVVRVVGVTQRGASSESSSVLLDPPAEP